jgi:hypothetical protein
MAWDIEFTDEFGEWFRNLDDAEKVSVTASVDLLEELGPALGRPHVDTLKGSRVPNMKELRVQHAGKPYRILFAFDPRQTGILLIGGRKGAKDWYRKMIALAERLYAKYLMELKKEGLL